MTKFFVFTILLCTLMRAGSFFLIAVLKLTGNLIDPRDDDQSGEEYETSFMDFSNTKALYSHALVLTLIFPDVMVVSVFAVLVLIYSETFILCREHTHTLARFRRRWFKGYLVLIPTIFSFQIVLFLLFISNASIDSLEWVYYFIASANFVVPILWMCLGLYLSCKFAGFPFKSELSKTKASQSSKTMILWSIGRLLFGFMKIGETNWHWYDGLPDNARAILLVLVYIASEIVPFLWSISSSYLEYITQVTVEEHLFVRNSVRRVPRPPSLDVRVAVPPLSPRQTNCEPLIRHWSEDNAVKKMTPITSMFISDDLLRTPKGNRTVAVESGDDGTIKSADHVDSSDVHDLEVAESCGSSLSCAVYRGTLNDRDVQLTIVHLPPTKMKIQSDLLSNVIKLSRSYNSRRLFLPLVAVSSMPSGMWLIRDKVSPSDWLSNQIKSVPRQNVTWLRRMRIASHLAKALKYVESLGRVHGNLSCDCVVVRNDRVGRTTIKLSGWELHPLTSFMRSTSGEGGHSMSDRAFRYPALVDRSDTYTFGMSMWSILSWERLDKILTRHRDSIGIDKGNELFDMEVAMSVLKDSADAIRASKTSLQSLAILFQSCVESGASHDGASPTFSMISSEFEKIIRRETSFHAKR